MVHRKAGTSARLLLWLTDNVLGEAEIANLKLTDAYEVRTEIISIDHIQLGRIKGIIAIGLDYTIYLWEGEVLYVNAEENPGKIENEALCVGCISLCEAEKI